MIKLRSSAGVDPATSPRFDYLTATQKLADILDVHVDALVRFKLPSEQEIYVHNIGTLPVTMKAQLYGQDYLYSPTTTEWYKGSNNTRGRWGYTPIQSSTNSDQMNVLQAEWNRLNDEMMFASSKARRGRSSVAGGKDADAAEAPFRARMAEIQEEMENLTMAGKSAINSDNLGVLPHTQHSTTTAVLDEDEIFYHAIEALEEDTDYSPLVWNPKWRNVDYWRMQRIKRLLPKDFVKEHFTNAAKLDWDEDVNAIWWEDSGKNEALNEVVGEIPMYKFFDVLVRAGVIEDTENNLESAVKRDLLEPRDNGWGLKHSPSDQEGVDVAHEIAENFNVTVYSVLDIRDRLFRT
jgi:hypothetical protein